MEELQCIKTKPSNVKTAVKNLLLQQVNKNSMQKKDLTTNLFDVKTVDKKERQEETIIVTADQIEINTSKRVK